jgi:hypothetical protein
VESPFNQRDYDRFGIEILQKNGFEVEVWDFTPFLYPRVHKEVVIPDPINFEKCISFPTQHEALSAIFKLEQNCLIVCLLVYQLKSFPIFRTISIIKLPYCVVMANALPTIYSKKRTLDLCSFLKKIGYYQIINAIFCRLPYNYFGIQPANIILGGGAKSIKYNYPFNKKTEILWLHALDYDLYLKEYHNPITSDEKMGVFLDEYLPFHPDYIYQDVSAPCTPEEYYPAICKFFDFIESVYGVHIVIAAHPRSKYEDHPDYFGGRTVIRGKTIELVKKSGFTIGHMSTSMNFAVLFNKSVIFITSNKLQQSIWGSYIELMASHLGKTPVNIDKFTGIDWEKEMSINEKAYIDYKHSYIKKAGSKELPFWQILANRVKDEWQEH